LSGSELNVLSRYIAESSQVSSVAFDPSLVDSGGNSGVAAPTLEFLAAKNIIDKNCLGCHGIGSQNGIFADLSQDQFIRKGLISPKNLAGSQMYSRLTGVSVGPGPGNMPLGKAALSDLDKTVIANWINSIQ
jgi:mono/diheme cytochrome c family protein